MHTDSNLIDRSPSGVVTVIGGHTVARRTLAPLGRVLPYRRSVGEAPMPAPSRTTGWAVQIGNESLGDMLLALGAVAAFRDAFPYLEVDYFGPRSELISRCLLPMTLHARPGPETFVAGQPGDTFRAEPERPPTWLDPIDHDRTDVHAALPMRYYLEVEQLVGKTLPARLAPALTFTGSGRPDPWHVVFVSATSWPGRKDYGLDGFLDIAQCLKASRPGPWRFTLIPGVTDLVPAATEVSVLAARSAADCLDVFASAALIVGNDTGLTHLAALTRRADGTSPQVIGLYGRHAHSKWTTGRRNHHAVATAFSQRLSDADRCPVRDMIDDRLWGSAADIRSIPASAVASFALRLIAAPPS